MNSKPVIGITTRPRNDRGTFEVSAKYIDSVRRAGGVPVLLPPGEADPAAVLAGLDGLIFSGGGDIDPREYAGDDHPEIYGMDAERDAFELALARTVMGEGRTPTLGICRGMQMLAHWAGTGLKPLSGHVRTRHQLSGQIVAEVNSYHTLALAACPEDFEVLARSEDGAIEAIGHRYRAWQGWMWHPEREAPFSPHDLQRLQRLFGELASTQELTG